MLPEERKQLIISRLETEGRIVAKGISHSLGVSEDTIRRDLRELARLGQLKRVHGGAIPIAAASAPFEDRLAVSSPEKEEIGRIAATLIGTGQVAFLDGGTTALAVAYSLPKGLRATIVTHSPNVALTLMPHEQIEIELIGGRLFRHSVVTSGATTMAALQKYQPDLCFIGATGLHSTAGITTGDSEEAEVKRAIIKRSGSVYILASSEKLGAVSPFELAGWSDVDGVVLSPSARSSAQSHLPGCPADFVTEPAAHAAGS